jgi:ABC-type methionine transport system permease subunit
MAAETHNVMRKPSLGLAAVRVVLITFISTLLSFAVGLFFGIVGVVLVNMAKGGALNMNLAYRHVAFPLAMVATVITFVVTLRWELRRYRQARAEYVEWKKAA